MDNTNNQENSNTDIKKEDMKEPVKIDLPQQSEIKSEEVTNAQNYSSYSSLGEEDPQNQKVNPYYREQSASVVLAQNPDRVPKWFYALFIITFVIFLSVTGLLIYTFTQNKTVSNQKIAPTKAPSPTTTVPPPSPEPTLPDPAKDQEVVTLKNLSQSDELPDIIKDVDNTDFSKVDVLLPTIASKYLSP